jgi:formate hydrogenlyase subunit 6/NADH:ubiquinone oxidoreductase subunit I
LAPIIGKFKAAFNSWIAYSAGLRHLLHKPYTLRFPQQRYAVEAGFRGRHLLHLDRCTGCGICAWICPEKCITIVQRGDRWFPQYFYGRCCFCHFCVTPDTLVTTNPSVTPISQVKVGDRVLTHTGQYREVRQVLTRKYSGKLYSIRPLGAPHPLKVTADHPLLVAPRRFVKKGRLEKKPGHLVWKTPTQLKQGDYLTMPIAKEIRDTDFYEQDVVVGQPITGKRLVRKLKLKAEPDLFRLIGYYLAEGHTIRRTVGLTFGEQETDYIRDAAQLLEKFFNGHTKKSNVHNATQVLLHSVVALQYFETFGRGAENKKLPDWVMFAPLKKQRELVKGAWRGDGYFHRPTKGNRATFFEYITVSRTLAFQLQQVLFRLGIPGQVFFTQHKNRKPAYVVTVRGRFVKDMAALMGLKFKDSRTKSFSRFEMDDRFVYAPIQKIASTDVNGQPVVNLSVEGDESYVAGNVTAHNCTDYCPEFALEETVEYDIAEYSRELLVWSPERLARPPVKKEDKYVFSVDGPRGASQVPEQGH